MITVDAAEQDLDKIEASTSDPAAKAIVKALKVVVKFLSTMRSNQLLTEKEKENLAVAKAKRIEEQNKKGK